MGEPGVFIRRVQVHGLIRDRDWEPSWTAWHMPADQREALRAKVVTRYGARYELIVSPTSSSRRSRRRPGKTGRKAIRMPQPERREALPDHPVSAGLAARKPGGCVWTAW